MQNEMIMFDESCSNNMIIDESCSNNMIIVEKDEKRGIAKVIGFRILAHVNPHLCERGWLLPVNGKRFMIGQDIYEVRKTEGIVGYPERIGLWATAILV